MALFKCKMCGGDLNITADEKIIECEFCGTTQTIPTSKDENLQGLFNRANILRMKSEFDKAEQLYEMIIEKDETQAEAYWGLILCKYGIEYVKIRRLLKESLPATEHLLILLLQTRIINLHLLMQILFSVEFTRQKQRKLTEYKKVFLSFHRKKNHTMFSFVIRKQTTTEKEPKTLLLQMIYTISLLRKA